MNLIICHSDGRDFILSNGVKPKFTVINQQDGVQPESGQLPAKAFEKKTVFLTGQGTPTNDGWIYSSRVVAVLELPLEKIKEGF